MKEGEGGREGRKKKEERKKKKEKGKDLNTFDFPFVLQPGEPTDPVFFDYFFKKRGMGGRLG